MTRPVIGLCAAVERARWTVWDDEAVLLPRGYADAVQRAGGLAIMLPPERVDDPSEWLSLLDGLILAGGADYGENPLRDEFDWKYVNYAPITVGALLLIVGIWWAVRAKHTFTGPVRTVEFDDGAGVNE